MSSAASAWVTLSPLAFTDRTTRQIRLAHWLMTRAMSQLGAPLASSARTSNVGTVFGVGRRRHSLKRAWRKAQEVDWVHICGRALLLGVSPATGRVEVSGMELEVDLCSSLLSRAVYATSLSMPWLPTSTNALLRILCGSHIMECYSTIICSQWMLRGSDRGKQCLADTLFHKQDMCLTV